jgi:hypothetical protein
MVVYAKRGGLGFILLIPQYNVSPYETGMIFFALFEWERQIFHEEININVNSNIDI